jgi:hypothetical protein
MKQIYGVWLPPAKIWARNGGFDFISTDLGTLVGPGVIAVYDRGHYFPSGGMCPACTASPRQARDRWCPRSNPSPELEASDLARKLWDTDDDVAALTVSAAEGREPTPELLDRLFDRDVGGLRTKAVQRARAMLG